MPEDFHILIVEDELLISEAARRMLINSGYQVIGVADNVSDARQMISAADKIDLVLLDIDLSDEASGLDLGLELKNNHDIPFIYLTSYDDPNTIKYAAATSPEAYLIKPYAQEDLYATIEMIRARNASTTKLVTVKEDDLDTQIQSSDILFMSANHNNVEITTDKKMYVIRHSLESFLKEVNDENLVRVHRSYAVNLMKVDAINGQHVIIGNTKCPLSRNYKKTVFKLFTYN